MKVVQGGKMPKTKKKRNKQAKKIVQKMFKSFFEVYLIGFEEGIKGNEELRDLSKKLHYTEKEYQSMMKAAVDDIFRK